LESPNVILVLLDGARWDRLEQSQDFFNLVQGGTLLNNVNTAIPYTIGSVNVLFSGLYGKDNGIDAYYKMFRLKDSVKIFSEILQENNYFTVCDLLSDKIISKRGFDIHQSHDEYVDDLSIRHPDFLKTCLQKANGKPLFAFLHFTRIHTVTVSEVLKKYNWDDQKFYDKKTENLLNYDKVFDDAGIYANLINNTINELGIKDNTLLIFLSDHGTGVGERFGERNYGSFTFEETIRSFYLFLGKNIQQNQLSSSLRETIDILPTILDLIKIKPINDLPGQSFAKFLVGKSTVLDEKPFVFSETGALEGPFPSPAEPNVFCIKNPNFKLIFHKTLNEWQLYDLKNDPDEKNNLYGKKPEIENELKNKLSIWINR
jgi:arylsulfatase A-like enzyme